MMVESQDVLIETHEALGRIRLNRPKAINSLTLEMVQEIAAALRRFAEDSAIGLVLVTGEGERGLCAGGDIRALYDQGRDGSGFGARFFQQEYRMNAEIAAYPKPYLAVMDGITMGGGVGIAAHGAIRIVTERTRMAMPETGIGFFPDVGGTWLLSHCPGEIGTFIGLTGDSFGGADAIYAGLADLFVQRAKIPELIAALGQMPAGASLAEIRAVVEAFADATIPPLAAHRAEIDRCFRFDTVEEIAAALQASDSEFAQKTLAVMRQKSPTSMKVALRLLRCAAKDTQLKTSLQREFEAAHAVLASNEFYEGVRAAVVDKDRKPQWSPATLPEVTEAILEKYFSQTAEKLF
jgi:enoyl-CoA hydratase